MNKERTLALTTGLALFCMFFGSGNLVFPLIVGTFAGANTFWATLGLILTAVFMPLLGCIGILLYKGEPSEFFKPLGRKGFLLFSFACLALMGPFGVLARCLTVAHGTFIYVMPDVSLATFSLVSCILLFGAALFRDQIMKLLGNWLTPLLLLSLGGIFVFCLLNAAVKTTIETTVWEAFAMGSSQGYQTMDLMASLFFSGFVIAQLRTQTENSSVMMRVFFRAVIVAGLLLATVYAGLVFLGFQYSALLTEVSPQSMLATIVLHVLGTWGGAVVCVAFALACYTTALVLTVLFSDFIRKEFVNNKVPEWSTLLLTLVCAFAISTLDFSGIAEFLAPILETSYPFLIAFTVWNIVRALWSPSPKMAISE
ncbi:MAG: branched-chain amino acid transport system II carrier protein [Parachlamydiales bacterium]|jgi:LIVCS family branched-chain amino acid:cation transporter